MRSFAYAQDDALSTEGTALVIAMNKLRVILRALARRISSYKTRDPSLTLRMKHLSICNQHISYINHISGTHGDNYITFFCH
jgi:hypothetical protein